jgi:hypothetical protein
LDDAFSATVGVLGGAIFLLVLCIQANTITVLVEMSVTHRRGRH